jgi:anti-anti-sigma regulatory factor
VPKHVDAPVLPPIAARRVGFRHVLTPAGRFDSGALAAILEAYFSAVDQGAQEVWIDLCRATGIRGAGIDALTRIAAFAHEVGRRTVVICPPGALRATLDRAGIAEDLEIFDSLSDAQRAC